MKAKYEYKKKKKRLGCGAGSGSGKTASKGHKGQRARSGVSIRAGFEGGQNPLYRRLPKRGFNRNRFRIEYAIVNIACLEKLELAEVSPDILLEKGVIKTLRQPVKILGDGNLSRTVTVKAHHFSETAREKITRAGGQAVLLNS